MKNKIILSIIFLSILLILCFNPANSLSAGQKQLNEVIQHSGKTSGGRPAQFSVSQKKLKLVHSVNKYRCNGWFYIVTSLYFAKPVPVYAMGFNKAMTRLVYQNYIKKYNTSPKTKYEGSTFMDWNAEYHSRALISLVCNIHDEGSGCHPVQSFQTLTYSLTLGKVLALSDLFMANSPYLKVISDYCIQSLLRDPRKIRESSINEGAAPSVNNYKSWVITSKGLQVYFDDYQVACYADGPSVVLIPWKVLKRVLDPHGSAGNIAFQTKKKQACEYGEFEKKEMEMHI